MFGWIDSKEALGDFEGAWGDLSKARLDLALKIEPKIVLLFDRFGCQKGSISESFLEAKSVEKCILTKFDVKNDTGAETPNSKLSC